MKILRSGLAFFMVAFAVGAGVAALRLAAALVSGSAAVTTNLFDPRIELIGRAMACGMFSWFAFALWRKNRMRGDGARD